jgi:hypothetical protein
MLPFGRAKPASPIFYIKVGPTFGIEQNTNAWMIVAALFLSQKNVLNPTTTLYAVFFGIKYALEYILVY